MDMNLLNQLEKKVEQAIEIIEILKLQIDELEEENSALKAEQTKWRDDLAGLLARFDAIDSSVEPSKLNFKALEETFEEEFQMTFVEEKTSEVV